MTDEQLARELAERLEPETVRTWTQSSWLSNGGLWRWQNGAGERPIPAPLDWNFAGNVLEALRKTHEPLRQGSAWAIFAGEMSRGVGVEPSSSIGAYWGSFYTMLRVTPRMICEAALEALDETRASG